MHPQLLEIERELARSSDQARALVAAVDEERFHNRPEADRWSIADCLVHLNLTTSAFLPLIDTALEAWRILGRRAPARFRLDFTGWLLCWISEPPHRHRIRTVAPFIPGERSTRDVVLADYLRLQGALADRVRGADGLDLSELTITSPFDQRLTYHLYSCFRVLPAHQRRHLWQAEQVRARLSPSGADAA